jgi:hypothetical protein
MISAGADSPLGKSSVHLWHIARPGHEPDVVLAITAVRIIVAHSGTLIFLDPDQQPILALAPGAWTSVERVATDPSGEPLEEPL